MLKDMKWFVGAADVDDMRRAIDAMKAAERALTDAFVKNAQAHTWSKDVPVRKHMADKLRSMSERIGRVRSEMQEDDFQFRRHHSLSPPPDGYS